MINPFKLLQGGTKFLFRHLRRIAEIVYAEKKEQSKIAAMNEWLWSMISLKPLTRTKNIIYRWDEDSTKSETTNSSML
ncbi:MAG: hypothetical protein MHPSP_001265 [Paramarteilia canceri]